MYNPRYFSKPTWIRKPGRVMFFRMLCCVVAATILALAGCGGGNTGGETSGLPPSPTVTSVTVTTAETTVLAGQTLQFAANVKGTGAFHSAVTWDVNGIIGGNAQNGTISDGNYVAPTSLPNTNPVTVTATSRLNQVRVGHYHRVRNCYCTNKPIRCLRQDATVHGDSCRPAQPWAARVTLVG
jgi:hypothetical protein